MSRRLLAAVFGGAAVLGASIGIAGGLIAVGVVRRFGPVPSRPGGALLRREVGESPEVFGHRVGEVARKRAEQDR